MPEGLKLILVLDQEVKLELKQVSRPGHWGLLEKESNCELISLGKLEQTVALGVILEDIQWRLMHRNLLLKNQSF